MNISNTTVMPAAASIDGYRLSTTVCPVLGIACVILLLNRFLGTQPDVAEPRFISSKIPYIGHMLGLMRYKMRYYTIISEKYPYGVFTLPMFGGRLYVVTDPNFVATIQRHYKALSFWFLEGAFTVKLGALSEHGARLLTENAAGREIGTSLVVDGMKETHTAMSAGLNSISQAAVDIIAASMDQLESEGPTDLDLWRWVDDNVALMTSGAVYGPLNPYADLKIARSLKAFSEDSSIILSGIFPSILAPKGYAGRERIVRAFQEYFAKRGHESGSELIKARVRSLTAYGISAEDIARFEAVNGFGILINTIPTAFWSVYHVFSDPEMLTRVREIALPLLSISTTEEGSPLYTLDIRQIREIPLLVSIMHESLRYHSSGAAARMVMEDFTLDKYLLKKDSMLMIPNREIHFHTETWGDTVNNFDPSRFMKTESQARVKKAPAGAFRGFGSGVNLCPGKNFATVEILAVIAMMALRFEITSVSGSWKYPGDDTSNMSTVITSPQNSVPIRIRPRPDFKAGKWVFQAARS